MILNRKKIGIARKRLSNNMNFSQFFNLLEEANAEKRIEFLYNRYKDKLVEIIKRRTEKKQTLFKVLSERDPDWMDKEAKIYIKDFVNLDPTKGIYAEWVVRHFLKLTDSEIDRWAEDRYKIKEDLEKYHKYKHLLDRIAKETGNSEFSKYKDINKIDGFVALYNLITSMEVDIENEKNSDVEKEAEKVYSSENYYVIVPKTKAAAILYSKGTRWCSGSTGSYNYFDQYNRQGPLYIIIDRKKNEKFQFHFQSKQYMDATDSPVELEKFFHENEEIKPLFIDLALKHEAIDFIVMIDVDAAIKALDNIEDKEKLNKYLKSYAVLAFHYGLKNPEYVNSIQNLFVFNNSGLIYLNTGADDWIDLIDFVGESYRGHERDTAKTVLNGDLEIYDRSIPSYESDFFDWLDSRNQQLVIDYVNETYEKEFEEIEDVQQFVDDEDIKSVKDALRRAMAEVERSAEEAEYYDIAINSIKDSIISSKYTFSFKGKYIHIELPSKVINDMFDDLKSHNDDGNEPEIPETNPSSFMRSWLVYLQTGSLLVVPRFDNVYPNSPSIKEYGDIFNDYFYSNDVLNENYSINSDMSEFNKFIHSILEGISDPNDPLGKRGTGGMASQGPAVNTQSSQIQQSNQNQVNMTGNQVNTTPQSSTNTQLNKNMSTASAGKNQVSPQAKQLFDQYMKKPDDPMFKMMFLQNFSKLGDSDKQNWFGQFQDDNSKNQFMSMFSPQEQQNLGWNNLNK